MKDPCVPRKARTNHAAKCREYCGIPSANLDDVICSTKVLDMIYGHREPVQNMIVSSVVTDDLVP